MLESVKRLESEVQKAVQDFASKIEVPLMANSTYVLYYAAELLKELRDLREKLEQSSASINP